MSTTPLIRYEKVCLEQRGQTILQDIDLTLLPGELVYLTGRVGSGKTTLLRSVYGDVPISSGTAQVLDYDMTQLRQKDVPWLRRQLGIVFQDFKLLADRNVVENLRFVLQATGWHSMQEMDQRIEQTLQQVSMTHKAYRMPHQLSGGEQQRVAIARAILNAPKVVLADEPTGNLDPETSVQIVSLLHSLAEQGIAVIMATHNLQLVGTYPARTLHCQNLQLINNE